MSSISHNRRLHISLRQIAKDIQHRQRNQRLRLNHITQTQPRRNNTPTPALDPGKRSGAGILQRVDNQRIRNRIIQHALMRVDQARRLSQTRALQERVRRADVARVVDEARGGGAFLRLDDLVRERVHGGGGDVGGVAAIGVELGDEGGVVLLLEHGGHAGDGVAGCEARTDDVRERGAVVVGRDGDVVGDDFGDRGPVLEGPLGVEGALRPGYDCRLGVGDGVEVLESVGDVLGADLGVGQQVIGDVQIDWVCEILLCEKFADIGTEIDVSRRSCARGHENGLLLAPSEAGGDVDCGAELVLGCCEGCVAGNSVVECLQRRHSRVGTRW